MLHLRHEKCSTGLSTSDLWPYQAVIKTEKRDWLSSSLQKCCLRLFPFCIFHAWLIWGWVDKSLRTRKGHVHMQEGRITHGDSFLRGRWVLFIMIGLGDRALMIYSQSTCFCLFNTGSDFASSSKKWIQLARRSCFNKTGEKMHPRCCLQTTE